MDVWRGEDHHAARGRHKVGAVARHDDEQDVHEDPQDEGRPEEDGGVVAGLAVGAAPAEALGVDGQVLGHRQDGVGQALDEGGEVLLLQLGGAVPGEALVEVDVHGGVVVDGHGLEGDVGVRQADVDAHLAHDLLVGEGAVGR